MPMNINNERKKKRSKEVYSKIYNKKKQKIWFLFKFAFEIGIYASISI